MKMATTRLSCAIALALACPCALRAADAAPGVSKPVGVPAAQGAELSLEGAGPYFTFHLPMAMQSKLATTDLRDLQVVNARGEAMPFAWVESLPATSEQRVHAVPTFKLPGAASGAATTPPRSWMLDARRVNGSLLRLDLTLPEAARGVYTLSVESSPDLQRWQTVLPSVQVLSLEHQGQRLINTSIDLGGARAAYFRLTAWPGSLLPELRSAQVTSVNEQAAVQPVQWSQSISASSCAAQFCDYALPKNVPLEQVQLQLAEANTLAKVELLGEMDSAVPAEVHRKRHLLRLPLTALRDKSEPRGARAMAANWFSLRNANVYWLRPPEGEVRTGPIPVDGGFYSFLRVQTSGPVTQLGSPAPTIRVGERTPTMVFLTRGPGPYRLAWGDPLTAQAAMPLSQLMPGRKSTDALPQDVATVLIAKPVVAVAPVAASVPPPTEPSSSKPLWLWAALLAGLAGMGFMAWSLLKKASTEEPEITGAPTSPG